MDFGFVTELDAEAIGEPGQRVFRVRVRKEGHSASLWLEKQQLQALSLALRQVLEQTDPRPRPHGDLAPAIPLRDFPEKPSLDLHVGRLALGWDDSNRRIVLQVFAVEAPEDAAPSFSCMTSAEHILAFCELADTVCAAGRPICFLCRQPINPEGHTCVRSNGHRGEAVPREEGEEKEE